MERVHKGGAKFDYEKAKWFNHEWIKRLKVKGLRLKVKEVFENDNINIDDDKKLDNIIELVKDRCTLLTDFVQQASFFFQQPTNIDIAAIKPKWNEQKQIFFVELIRAYELLTSWQHDDLEKEFKEMAAAHQIKPGELMLPLRIMLVGGKFGPGVFDIAVVLGKEETIKRIKNTLQLLQ
jgi:glutamyl-tRNA synthetase